MVSFSPTDPFPDDDLLAGCLSGERAAQYQRYKTTLFSTALRILGNWELAQDALQEAFVKVFQQLATFRWQCPLAAWMQTIVVRQALLLRVESRTEVYDATRHPEPLVGWHDNLTGEALEKAIGELPAGSASCFA